MVQTFDEWLAEQPDDRLAQIIAKRPDVAMPSPPSFELLASRLLARSSVLRVADQLTLVEVEVISLLALRPGMTPAAVAKATGSLAHRAAAEGLLATGLVCCGDGGSLWLPAEVEHVLAAHPFGLGRPGDQLRRMAQSHWGVASPEPADLAVTQEERELLEHLDAGGGVGTVADALAALREGDGLVAGLVQRGLLVPIDAGHVELPRELGIALRGQPWQGAYGGLHPALPPARGSRSTTVAVDRAGAAQALEALRLVELLLESWTDQPPTELRSGGVGVRDLRVAGKLLGVDLPTVALLIEVAHGAGLLDRSARLDAVWLPTLDYDTWLHRSAADRWIRLVQAWLDLRRLPGLVGTRDEKDRVLSALSEDGVR